MTGILGGLIATFVARGYTWATQDVGTARLFSAGAYAPLTNGSYFMFTGFGTDANNYNYSTDTASWTASTLPATTRIGAAAFDGTRLLIVSANQSDDAWTTTNGTTWTLRDTGGAAKDCRKVIHDGTQFVAAFANLGRDAAASLRASTDGTTWTTPTSYFSSGNNRPIKDIAFGNGRYIALREDTGTSSNDTSTSLTTGWGTGSFPASDFWISVVFGNGIWVANRDGSSSYATSTNGTTWTGRTLPSAFGFSGGTDQAFNKTVFADGAFYYQAANNSLYKSTDGINWTVESTASSGTTLDEIAAWAVGGNRIVGIGYSRSAGNNIAVSDIILKGTK